MRGHHFAQSRIRIVDIYMLYLDESGQYDVGHRPFVSTWSRDSRCDYCRVYLLGGGQTRPSPERVLVDDRRMVGLWMVYDFLDLSRIGSSSS